MIFKAKYYLTLIFILNSPDTNSSKMYVKGSSVSPQKILRPNILCTVCSSHLKLMFSERLVKLVCGTIIVIAILTPPHLRLAIFLMVLAYYYLTLLSLKEMAHLILWRINRTAFLVVMKEAGRVRTRSERPRLQNPEISSGGRLQSSSCCQLLNNSLKTLTGFKMGPPRFQNGDEQRKNTFPYWFSGLNK